MNTLVIASNKKAGVLFPLFEHLAKEGDVFYFLTNDPVAAKKCAENKWRSWSLPRFIRDNRTTGFAGSVLWLPVTVVSAGWLVILKYRYAINTIVCFGTWEKVGFSGAARFLGIKTVWLECPGNEYGRIDWLTKKILTQSSSQAEVIACNIYTKKQLMNIGIKIDRISNINLGISLNDYQLQDNIFSKLVEKDRGSKKRKFFSVGTVADLGSKHKVEILLQAAKKCADVIPELQVVIIGDGGEKKTLLWLAKKLGIENIVWFVGQQNHLKKWLEHMDVFVNTSPVLDIDNLIVLIRCLAAGLPVVSSRDHGLDEMIEDYVSGLLLEIDDSEHMAQGIIQLYQNKELRNRISRQAQAAALTKHSIGSMAKQFADIIKK